MPPSLRVTDFNDREILRIIDEVADKDGWADMLLIAERIFPTYMRGESRRRTATRCVGTRLSWMKRYGVVTRRIMQDRETHTRYTQWSLTSAGETFLRGHLTAAQEAALMDADDGRIVAAAEILAQRYIGINRPTATMIRRQWQFGYGQRRR